MHSCPKCSSEKLHKRGTISTKSHKNYQQYKCTSCNNRFQVELPHVVDSTIAKSEKYVITYYQKNTDINYKLLKTLISYSEANGANLLIATNMDEIPEDYPFASYFVNSNFTLGEDIIVYSKLNISPTIENPLTGLDTLSKGKSLIIGHNALAMRMLPVFGDSHPIMLHSTGTISIPSYNTERKMGAKAHLNHSYSALVIEMDNDCFHFRQLNSGEDGSFYDIDKFYDGDKIEESGGCKALILGDVHVAQINESIVNATYKNEDSIVNICRPEKIVMHDVLDFNQVSSHHNQSSILSRYALYVDGNDSIVRELNTTCQFLVDNTPNFVKENIIVSANHNDHLTKWMESNFDKLFDYKNLKIYHWLMYKSLDNIESGEEVNPFRDYFQNFYGNTYAGKATTFLGREDLYFIGDILVSQHGDKGIGGSKFSATQGGKLPHKMVVGHSHSPTINKNLWVAGTCTGKLGYTAGTPSSWLNSHIIIHENNKRQMINIIKGKWRV